MDNDVELIRRQPEQVVSLDQLKALVHECSRVDGNFWPHGPSWMFQRLLDCDLADGLERPRAEWPAGCRKHNPADIFARTSAQRLENRVVLGINRKHRGTGGCGLAHKKRSGANQTFLVG